MDTQALVIALRRALGRRTPPAGLDADRLEAITDLASPSLEPDHLAPMFAYAARASLASPERLPVPPTVEAAA